MCVYIYIVPPPKTHRRSYFIDIYSVFVAIWYIYIFLGGIILVENRKIGTISLSLSIKTYKYIYIYYIIYIYRCI